MATPLSDVTWIHGAADCHSNVDPRLQVHRFNADTFIMRENKCYSRGHFMCPLLGTDKALLLDTGDLRDADSLLPRTDLPLGQAMHGILAERQPPLELIVVHTHSHHLFWDGEFSPATVVGHDHRSIMEQFGLSDWPDGRAVFDLGGRPFDAFPTPSREPHHIALCDRNAWIATQADAHSLPAELTGGLWLAAPRCDEVDNGMIGVTCAGKR